MKQRILRKLSSNAGESIGETLVALLISALALMMLAGAVTSAMRVVTRSKRSMDEYYQVNNAVAARATAAPDVDSLDPEGFTGTLTVTLSGLLPEDDEEIDVDYWKNDLMSGAPVIAYTKQD